MTTRGQINAGYINDDNSTENISPKNDKFYTIDLNGKPKKEEPYDPYQHRIVKKPTTNFDTLVHLLKGSFGTGILAMPYAFHHSGYVVGTIGTITIGIVCCYCIHILLHAHYEICKRRRVPSLGYPSIAEYAMLEGPKWMHKYSRLMYHTTNIFLLTYVIGTCCVYAVFVASNIKDIADYYIGKDIDIRIYLLIILLPLILINMIRNLKLLAPFSAIANIFTAASFIIIWYYIFREPITLEGKRPVGTFSEFPLFFGTVLFALEAIYVIMPLENEMKTPKSFGGCFGVLNWAMIVINIIYVLMGLFGYLRFGKDVKDSITLSLPKNEWLAQAAKGMLAFGIFITHGLAGYVAIDITWTEYVSDTIKKHPKKTFMHYIIRLAVVLETFVLAIAIPNLALFISLFGAFCLSSLGLAYPAIIEIATFWKHRHGKDKVIMIIRASILIFVGFAGLIIGTYTSIVEIIKTFILTE